MSEPLSEAPNKKLFGAGANQDMPCARVYRLTPFFEIRLALSAWARRDQLTSAEPEPRRYVGASFWRR